MSLYSPKRHVGICYSDARFHGKTWHEGVEASGLEQARTRGQHGSELRPEAATHQPRPTTPSQPYPPATSSHTSCPGPPRTLRADFRRLRVKPSAKQQKTAGAVPAPQCYCSRRVAWHCISPAPSRPPCAEARSPKTFDSYSACIRHFFFVVCGLVLLLWPPTFKSDRPSPSRC